MPQSSCGTYLLGRIPPGSTSKEHFSGYIVSAADEAILRQCAREDGRRYVYNGAASFLGAISGLHAGQSAWCVTQLYYAVFYFGRASLCRTDHIIFHAPKQNGSGFTQYELRLTAGAQATVVANPPSTHKLVAARFKQYGYPSFMTGLILDGMDPILWLMEKREYWQYRASRFPDPDSPPELDKFDTCKAQRLLEAYSNDKIGIYLSDLTHAIVSIPFRLAIWALNVESLVSTGGASEEDVKYLHSRCRVGRQMLTALQRHIH